MWYFYHTFHPIPGIRSKTNISIRYQLTPIGGLAFVGDPAAQPARNQLGHAAFQVEMLAQLAGLATALLAQLAQRPAGPHWHRPAIPRASLKNRPEPVQTIGARHAQRIGLGRVVDPLVARIGFENVLQQVNVDDVGSPPHQNRPFDRLPVLGQHTHRDLGRQPAYRRASTFHAGLMALTIKEHEKILRAILDMDEAAAASRMRGHLDTLRDDAVSMAKALKRATAKQAA